MSRGVWHPPPVAQPLPDGPLRGGAALLAAATVAVVGGTALKHTRSVDRPGVAVTAVQVSPLPSGSGEDPGPEAAPQPRAAAAARGSAPSAARVSGREPVASVKSEQRQAADALAEGNGTEAAARYRALANRHPDNPAYGRAAAILQLSLKQRARSR